MRKEEIRNFIRKCYVANPAATALLGLIVALWCISLIACLILGSDSFGYMLYYQRFDHWNDFSTA